MQAAQKGASLGIFYCCIDELGLVTVYTSNSSISTHIQVYTAVYQDQCTSGVDLGGEVTNHEGISIFIRLSVIFELSLPSMNMSWKWAAYAVDKDIMNVSATTVAK
jgi:hypothetical protein